MPSSILIIIKGDGGGRVWASEKGSQGAVI